MICNYAGKELKHIPEICAYDGEHHEVKMGQCVGCKCPNPYYEETKDMHNMPKPETTRE
jgi:hypothetical protein